MATLPSVNQASAAAAQDILSIEHHCQLASHCSFGPAVIFSSRVEIGDGVRFGTGIFIEPKLHIGAGSVIASGSILTVDVPPRSVLKARAGSIIRPLPGRGQQLPPSETGSE